MECEKSVAVAHAKNFERSITFLKRFFSRFSEEIMIKINKNHYISILVLAKLMKIWKL